MFVQILHVWPLHKLEGLGTEVGAAVSLISVISIWMIQMSLIKMISNITIRMIPMRVKTIA